MLQRQEHAGASPEGAARGYSRGQCWMWRHRTAGTMNNLPGLKQLALHPVLHATLTVFLEDVR